METFVLWVIFCFTTSKLPYAAKLFIKLHLVICVTTAFKGVNTTETLDVWNLHEYFRSLLLWQQKKACTAYSRHTSIGNKDMFWVPANGKSQPHKLNKSVYLSGPWFSHITYRKIKQHLIIHRLYKSRLKINKLTLHTIMIYLSPVNISKRIVEEGMCSGLKSIVYEFWSEIRIWFAYLNEKTLTDVTDHNSQRELTDWT